MTDINLITHSNKHMVSASAMCYSYNTLGHFIFPLKLSFKLGFRPKFGLIPN